MRDWHVHVMTSTYTADVSGVCSAMYELGGMTILHDPSGCNSTYTTHDEPRWYDTDSLMYVSGLDEMTAVMGDDSVLIHDVVQAAADLHPRFITLCGSSIPHVIAFDYRGCAHLIEKECGIPVLPAATDGLKLYTSGVGVALSQWLRRFADWTLADYKIKGSVNLLGVTPIDFSRQEIVDAMAQSLEARGLKINCTAAMGCSFEQLQKAPQASVSVVVSSAGLLPARLLQAKAGIPYVIGTPTGSRMCDRIAQLVCRAQTDGQSRYAYTDRGIPEGERSGDESFTGEKGKNIQDILIVGEEVMSQSLAEGIAEGCSAAGEKAPAMQVLWPDVDEGIDEDLLIGKANAAGIVIADPLYRNVVHNPDVRFVSLPHEGYSGRIFRSLIPVFTGDGFDPMNLI